jgi:hypothetical protein
MRALMLAASVPVALWLTTPAAAESWTVQGKWTCHESATGTSKLPTRRSSAELPIAACLGVAAGDPAVGAHSLVFDFDTSRLLVVRSCDGQIACILTQSHACADATDQDDAGFKTNGACLYRLVDFGAAQGDGEMACREIESGSFVTDALRFRAACHGMVELDGRPCTFKLKTGRPFAETGSCPPP